MNSLKSILTSKWTKGAAIVIAIAAITLLVFHPKKGEGVQEVKDPLKLEEVKQIRDQNGKLEAQLEQKVYTQVQVTHLLDSVAKVLKVKVKTIRGVERIVLKTDTIYRNLPTRPIFVVGKADTAYQVERHDGWNDIIATAGRDSGSIIFRSRDTISRVEIFKQPLFGSPTHYVYITNSNPYVKTTEGTSFIIKEKQPWLCIGPYGGYDPFLKQGSIGVGVMFPIITLKR